MSPKVHGLILDLLGQKGEERSLRHTNQDTAPCRTMLSFARGPYRRCETKELQTAAVASRKETWPRDGLLQADPQHEKISMLRTCGGPIEGDLTLQIQLL